jgi:hypothetical protein
MAGAGGIFAGADLDKDYARSTALDSYGRSL